MPSGYGLDSRNNGEGETLSSYRFQVWQLSGMSLPGRELLFFGRSRQRRRGAFPTGDGLGDGVEVASANLVLVLGCRITLCCGREFRFLQFRIRGHSAVAVTAGKIEH